MSLTIISRGTRKSPYDHTSENPELLFLPNFWTTGVFILSKIVLVVLLLVICVLVIGSFLVVVSPYILDESRYNYKTIL